MVDRCIAICRSGRQCPNPIRIKKVSMCIKHFKMEYMDDKDLKKITDTKPVPEIKSVLLMNGKEYDVEYVLGE